MPISRLNHAVLYVRDVAVTRDFYENALGFTVLVYVPGQLAFFRAPGSTNDHDLGTFQIGTGAGDSTAGRATVGLYHLAWEVDTLGELQRLRELMVQRGAFAGMSDHGTTKSLYCKDPDGLEFELAWILPAEVLTPELLANSKGQILPLDLEAEIATYGADRHGGIGVSVSSPS